MRIIPLIVRALDDDVGDDWVGRGGRRWGRGTARDQSQACDNKEPELGGLTETGNSGS